jgi:hypothetical protein
VSSSAVLTPAYNVTLGNQRWTTQATALTVVLNAAPAVSLANVAFPSAAPVSAQPGDPAIIELDGGEGAVAVLTGTVRGLTHTGRAIVVECGDAGITLANYRPAISFDQTSAASVIRTLCDDVGVDTGAVDSGPNLTCYVADPTRSALDHIRRLADFSGALAIVDGDGRLTTKVIDGVQPDLALRHDREVLGIVQRLVSDPIAAHVVAGEAGASATSPPEAARPTSDFFAGERPKGPGADSRWTYEPVLRTPDSAAVAGAARARLAAAVRRRTDLRTWLVPGLRPGAVVRLDELPEGLTAGPHWVQRVVHRVGPGGATSESRLAEAGPAFDPTALLVGAIGGLL